jgi:hypothetical protein
MSQPRAVVSPNVPAEAGGKGFKAELDGLRERMRALGLSHDEIAAEVSRRYQVRPRQAYRLAWGWTLDQAAARFNERAASEGTDPQGRASMTGPHLCEVEKWPDSSRKPSAYVLCLLAGVYGTDVRAAADGGGPPGAVRRAALGGGRPWQETAVLAFGSPPGRPARSSRGTGRARRGGTARRARTGAGSSPAGWRPTGRDRRRIVADPAVRSGSPGDRGVQAG